MQILPLNDNQKTIHAKFLAEHNSKISYSLFCKLKSFLVLKQTEKDRQTCLCRIHENCQYKINRLYHEKTISSSDKELLTKDITCNVKNKSCMYRECSQCKGR